MATIKVSVGNYVNYSPPAGVPTVTGSDPSYDVTWTSAVNASVEVGMFWEDSGTPGDFYLVTAISADRLTVTVRDQVVDNAPISTINVNGFFHAFTTIMTAEAAIATWAVAGDTYVVECHQEGAMPITETGGGFADTTLGTSGTFKITVADGEWHQGVPGSGFRWTTTATNWMLWSNQAEASCPNQIIERLEIIGKTTTTTHQYGIKIDEDGAGAQRTVLRNLILRDFANTSTTSKVAWGIHIGANADNGVRIENCLLYNILRTGTNGTSRAIAIDGDNALVYNCAGYNITDEGFWEGAATTLPIAKNCAVMTAGTCYSGGWNTASTNNGSSDATAPDNGGLNPSYESLTAANEWTTPGSDFHVKRATSVGLLNHGVDLSGTFTDDISGATRTVTWDIGVFAATAMAAIVAHTYRQRRIS